MTLPQKHWDRLSNGGLTFTEAGFGTSPLGNLFREISEAEAHDVLEAAWRSGIRYFDTAPSYGMGLAETRLNGFLRGKKRAEYILATKVGVVPVVCPPDSKDRWGIARRINIPSRTAVYDYSYDGVMRSLEMSFERLGVDHLDIVYVHSLDRAQGSKEAIDARIDELMKSGYKALATLRDQGVIKAFGCGIDDWEPAQKLVERGDFDIILLAGRYTLLEQEALQSFLPLCEKRGVGIVVGGVFNSGILATGAIDNARYDYEIAPDHIRQRVREIQAICERHGVKLADAALRFPLMHPAVLCILAGAQSVDEVNRNRAGFDAQIPAGLWRDLKASGLMRADAPTG